MIGRAGHLADLLLWLQQGAACVVGEPGMGKSLLLNEAVDAMRSAGDVVLSIRGTQSTHTVPWGALRSTEVAPWLPDAADSAAQLAEEVERRLAPDAVVVDEVHLLDHATLDWLRHTLITSPLPVLLAWRAGQMHDQELRAALSERGARTMHLEGLARDGVRMLAERAVGPVADSLTGTLHAQTGGSPMLVLSALEQWQEEGLLGGQGVTRLLGEPTPPRSLVQAAHAKLARLPSDQADAVLAVALAEPIRLEALAEVVSEEALEQCEAAGLVMVRHDRGGDLLLAGHPTVAQAATTLADDGRRQRVASALLSLPDPSISMVQRGTWLLLAPSAAVTAGGTSAEILTTAAEGARRFRDHDLAERLADAALSHGAGLRAHLVRVEIDMVAGRWSQADEVLAGLVNLATDDDERVLVANAHAYVLGQLGRGDDAGEVLRRATESVAPGNRPPLQVRAAINRLFEADAPGALAASADLVDDPDPGLRARACYAASIAHALTGDRDAAAGLADIGEAAFASLVPAPAVTQIGPALAGILAGDLDEAERRAVRLADQMLAAGDLEGEATGSFLLGRIALERADAAEAERQFRASLAVAEEIADPVAQRWARGGLLHALVLHGPADRRVAEASALADLLAAEPPPVQLFEDDVVVRALAYHRSTTGDPQGASQMLMAAAQRAAQPRRAVAALLALDALLLPSHPLRDMVPAGWCPPARPCAAMVAAALARVDLPTLEQAWETADTSGAHLASGALAARVVAALPAGSGSAALWRARSARVSALGPWQATSLPAPTLSPRQREVAERAAGGAAATEIADELGLSVRTVENHLHQAYRALGIRTRDELRDVLGT